MRIFVSYARVDRNYCIHIVNTLEVHDVWYDQRLYAGQQWWKEILRRLEWCEGFIYLLSPDSVTSEYCRKEFELAQSMGRHIFPVLIQENTPIPPSLMDVHYCDLSKGITPEAVKSLLNSIYIAERHKQPPPAVSISAMPVTDIKPPSMNPSTIISSAIAAMEKGHFDQAVYLLKQARSNGYTSRFINIDSLLKEAESSLERQAYLREAEREYRQIADLVKFAPAKRLGCEAFQAFRRAFPDYDPECLAQLCEEISITLEPVGSKNGGDVVTPVRRQASAFTLPMLEWCDIPLGITEIHEVTESGSRPAQSFYVDNFRMTKYPVTNGQYQIFLDDPMGYANPDWWQFSQHAYNWRMKNPQPKPGSFKGDERPREMVTWYDAVAFCRWLSARMGQNITLPTQGQWQRAAQGDTKRIYPWGDTFETKYANTRESGLKMTTLVTRYHDGISPYGVMDMAGNVWEWCLNAKGEYSNNVDLSTNATRAVHGGSFVSVHQRSQITFHYYLNPQTYYSSIGFRLVMA